MRILIYMKYSFKTLLYRFYLHINISYTVIFTSISLHNTLHATVADCVDAALVAEYDSIFHKKRLYSSKISIDSTGSLQGLILYIDPCILISPIFYNEAVSDRQAILCSYRSYRLFSKMYPHALSCSLDA